MKSSQNKKKLPIERNILASPYDKFWPLLESDDSVILSELLSRVLPLAAIPKSFIAPKKLKQIYREKDKLKRKELWKQNKTTLDLAQVGIAKQNKKYLLLGVNCVTKGIENKTVAACLISGDVSPRLMVNHIIIMAARSCVPVLVVPSLKEITRTSLKVPCLTLALHKSVAEIDDNHFHQLYEMIVKLAKKFDVPEHLVVTDNDTDVENDCEKKSDVISPVFISSNTTSGETDLTNKKLNTSNKIQYLYRSGTNQRVYVPPKVDIKLESDHMSFIPIKKTDESVCKRLKYHNKMIRRSVTRNETEDDDSLDDDDEGDDDNVIDDNFELLPDSDSLFFIDTKGTETNNSLKKSMDGFVNFKPAIVKKVKSNPNKRKRKKY